MGVGILGPNGLKANNYQNARFATTVSSFAQPSPSHSYKKKKKRHSEAREFDLSKSLEESSFVMVNLKGPE
jgi:hypothetical protein